MRTVPALMSVRSTWMSPLPSTLKVMRLGMASGAIRSSMPIRLNTASRGVASPSAAWLAVGSGLIEAVGRTLLARADGLAVGPGEAVGGRTVAEEDGAADDDARAVCEAPTTDDGVGDGFADEPRRPPKTTRPMTASTTMPAIAPATARYCRCLTSRGSVFLTAIWRRRGPLTDPGARVPGGRARCAARGLRPTAGACGPYRADRSASSPGPGQSARMPTTARSRAA